jgi:hypothetical protein
MEKRYQVFVSSTYSDLKEERGKVMQTIMVLDCIPAGMELFPAIDAEQFEFIKKIIDDCDYYILIVGGRYGSISDDGISYTEKEYDYAVSKGIPVIAFLHENIKSLTFEKSEVNPEGRNKLEAFREKVSKGRLVQFWNNSDELNGKVAVSLTKTIKVYPAVGWVRANLQSNTEALQEINTLRKKIEQLELEKVELKKTSGVKVENLAKLDEKIELFGKVVNTYETEYGEADYIDGDWSGSLSWRDIIATITPKLIRSELDTYMPDIIGGLLYRKLYPNSTTRGKLTNDCCDIIKIQLLALGILDERNITTGRWVLSKTGFQMMLNEGSVKTALE